jgi:hypothetical protein
MIVSCFEVQSKKEKDYFKSPNEAEMIEITFPIMTSGFGFVSNDPKFKDISCGN